MLETPTVRRVSVFGRERDRNRGRGLARQSVGVRMSSTPERVVPKAARVAEKKAADEKKLRKFGDAATERRPGNPF